MRGMMRCAEAEGVEGEVINLGTGIEISIGELVAARRWPARQASVPVELDEERLRPADSEVERLVADTAKAASCSAGSRRSTSTRACAGRSNG